MSLLAHTVFRLSQRWRHATRINAQAWLKRPRNIQLGARCKIDAFASLDAGQGRIVLGEGCTVNRYAMLQSGRGSVVFGDRVEVNNHSIINGSGGVEIGDNSLIGPGVRLISYQHQAAAGSLIREQAYVLAPIRIGADVWLGANVVVLAGVTIGDGAVVGAGAVVTQDIPPGQVWVGVPARFLRERI